MNAPENIVQTFNVMELISSIKWPLLVLIAFLLLLKPIKNLINRITKVGYGDKTLEATQQAVVTKVEEQAKSKIDRIVGIFRPETIETFRNFVEDESEITNLKTESEKIDRLMNYSCIIYIMKNFDTIYNSIFGSQIRILEKLNTLTPSTRESLKKFYEIAKKSNSPFFDNYSYEKYLEFLFDFTLIREDSDAISLTILGIDFLKYLTESNKDVNKPY
ncbi:MAG TPA: hypothetical protein VFC67_25265 [Prolixibacteraceae bacterium]|nr:hypothetical protein [Prolixibacteraceae bacterium]